jgi:hypothetical protein
MVAAAPALRRGRSASPAPVVPELDERVARAIGRGLKATRAQAVPKPNRVAKPPAKPKRGKKAPSPEPEVVEEPEAEPAKKMRGGRGKKVCHIVEFPSPPRTSY